jgi:hypothetical protein
VPEPPDIPSSPNPPQINATIESRQPDADNAQFFNSIGAKRSIFDVTYCPFAACWN